MGTIITSQVDAQTEYERLYEELTANTKVLQKAEDWVLVESSTGQEISLKVEELTTGQHAVRINDLLVVEQGITLAEILSQVAEPSVHTVTSHTTESNPVLSKLDNLLDFSKSQVTSAKLTDEGMVGGHWGTTASGIMFKCNDKILLLKRAAWVSDPSKWGVPGGAIPLDENGDKIDAFQSAIKECHEEIGLENDDLEYEAKTEFKSGNFTYTTFLVEVGSEFVPSLNNEHDDFRWFNIAEIPTADDIHPGVIFTLEEFSWFQAKKTEASVTEAKTSTDFKTAELYRGIKGHRFDDVDPLYKGNGVFGPGTYYALQAGVSHSYMNDDVYNWLLKYEFKFQNPLAIHSPEDMDLAWAKNEVDIHSEKFKDIFEGSEVSASGLSQWADGEEIDALYLLGNVDGGPQVLIPRTATPSYNLKAASLFLHDASTIVEIEDILGIKAKQDPREGSQKFFPSIPLDKIERVQTILDDLQEFVEGSTATAGANGNWEKEGYKIDIVGPVDFEGADDGEAEEFLKDNEDLRPIDINAWAPGEDELVGSLRVGRTKDRKNIYVWDVNIEEEHQRKGLASEMYRMAEKYFRLKLKAGVSGLSKDSEALWEQPNRSFGGAKGDWKKEGYSIEVIFNEKDSEEDDFKTLIIKAFDKNKKAVGEARFRDPEDGDFLIPDDSDFDSLTVDKKHQRKGLASAMYELAEKIANKKIQPSDRQSKDAKNFWKQPNRSFGSSNSNLWYHLTDDPKFKLDPNYEPEDNATHIYQRTGAGIYLSQSVETWVNGHNYWRPFVVEFEVDPSVKQDKGVHGRYGGEMFVPATSFSKLKLKRVIPLDAYAREEFGSYGWIETEIGTEFDTGKPLNKKEVYPFKGYKYTGPDVREMPSAQAQNLKKMLHTVKGSSALTTKEELEDEGYEFVKEIDGNFLTIKVYNTLGEEKEQVAQFEVAPSQADPSHLYPIHVGVEKAHRRKGLATVMYSMAEEHFGKPIKHGSQSPAGKAFRKAYDKKITSAFEDRPKTWIHYSRIPEMKVNPGTLFKDPAGIYLFPKDFTPIGNWTKFPYKFEVELKENLNVLDLSKLSEGEMKAIWEKFFPGISPEFKASEHTSMVDSWWEKITERMIGKAGELNKKFRNLGYDAIFDDTGSIHSAEEQLVILDPKAIKTYKRTENNKTGYDTLVELLNHFSEVSKSYGEVEVESPKKKKEMYSNNEILEGLLSVSDGDKSARWSIRTGPVEKGLGVPHHISISLARSSPDIKFSTGRSYGYTLDFNSWKTNLVDAEKEFHIAMQRIFRESTTSSTATAKAKAMTKKDWKELADSINQWVSHSDPEGLMHIQYLSNNGYLPTNFTSCDEELYRGHQGRKSDYKKLMNGAKFKIRPGSWSIEPQEAAKFAFGTSVYHGDETFRVLFKVKPKAGEVMLNLQEAIEHEMLEPYLDPDMVQRVRDEAEILMNEVSVTKGNVHDLKGVAKEYGYEEYYDEAKEAGQVANVSTSKLLFEATSDTPYMEVYRVEDSSGKGPYSDSKYKPYTFERVWEDPEHDVIKYHPTPREDGFNNEELEIINEDKFKGSKLFGFKNLDQVNRWFSPKSQELLKEHGYKIVKRKALKVWEGNNQVFFIPYDKTSVTAGLNVEFHTVLLYLEDCASEKDYQFKFLQEEIAKEDIYKEHPYQTDFPDGLEKQPHVTVLFGLKEEKDIPAIKKYFAEQPPIKFKIGPVKSFRNDDKPYDVLVVEIQSDDLQKHHWWIRENFDTQTSFPDYKPHMTLAYVKKDACKDLEGKHPWQGTEYVSDLVKFSHKDDYKIDLPLNVESNETVETVAKDLLKKSLTLSFLRQEIEKHAVTSNDNQIEVNFIGSKLSSWEKAYYTCYLNFLCPRLGINPRKVTIRNLAQQKSNRFGYVGELKNSNNVKIAVTFGSPWISLSRIAHEMIHVKQQLLNELTVDEGKKNFQWQGKNFISIEEYNKLGDVPADFKHVPWEQEAYAKQDQFAKEFLKSDELYNLASTEVPFVNMKAMIKEIYEGPKVISSTEVGASDQPLDTYSEYIATEQASGLHNIDNIKDSVNYTEKDTAWKQHILNDLKNLSKTHSQSVSKPITSNVMDESLMTNSSLGSHWIYNLNDEKNLLPPLQLTVEQVETWLNDNKFTLLSAPIGPFDGDSTEHKVQVTFPSVPEKVFTFYGYLFKTRDDWYKFDLVDVTDIVKSSTDLFENAYAQYVTDFNAGNYQGYHAPNETWYNEMKQNLGPFSQGKNLVYRAVSAENEDTIDFNKIGVFWSYNKDGARVYYGDKSLPTFIITAEITPENIDWKGTIEAYMKMVFGGEEEIKLNDKAEIDVVKVEKKDDQGIPQDTGLPGKKAAAEVMQ